MPTLRSIPVENTAPPFKAMLPYDHRILYLEYIPFLPVCFFGGESSESESESETDAYYYYNPGPAPEPEQQPLQ